ncbi:MAG TPA: hypothetical protein DC027_00785 [Oscillibacter sp.]|nr:hypothetical protein [Oscillibacter sp.]
MKQRILAILLSLTMMFTLVPTAMAEGEMAEAPAVTKVAKVGNVEYATLAEAVEAVPTDSTETEIVLLKDYIGSGIKVVAGKNIVFNLNGKTYTVDKPTVGSSGTETNGFQLLKDSKVTFKNGTLDSATGADSLPNGGILIQNYCDLTLENVTLDTSANSNISYVISNNFGSLTAKGNTVIKAADGKVAFDLWYGMNSNGLYDDGVSVTFGTDFTGSVTGKIEYGAHSRVPSNSNWKDKARLTIANGNFDTTFVDSNNNDGVAPEDFNITIIGGTFSSDVSAYVPNGYIQNENGAVETLGETNAVAKVGDTYYKTLAGAVTAAKNGETVTLLKNAEMTETIRITDGKKITLALDGHDVVIKTTGKFFLVRNGELTVTGTGMIKEETPYFAPIIIKGGAEKSENYSVVNVEEGVILEGWAGVMIDQTSNTTNNYGMVLNVNGATLKGVKDTDNAEGLGVYVNGVVADAKVTLNNATLTADGYGMYLAGNADTTITGGTVSGTTTGIEIRAGKLTLDNCDVTGGSGEVTKNANGNGSTVNNAALAISQHTTKKDIDVTINGGTYTGTAAVYQTDVQGTGSENVKVNVNNGKFNGTVVGETANKLSITGGYFTSDPTAYLAASHYVWASDKDGYTYMVKDAAPTSADQKITVVDKTDTAVSSDITGNDEDAINGVISKANVDGVAEAVTPAKKADIVSKSNTNPGDNDKVEIEVAVKVEAKAADLANGKLTFEASPVATVKVNGTATGTTVPVTNDMLNGNAITVKLPLPTGFKPEQIKHISSDGSVEYFLKTAKRGAKLFTVDSDNCAVFTITKFSTFELSGTVTYVEPSYYSGSSSAPTYSVTVDKTENGSVTVSPKSASKGDTVTVTVKPDSGYVLETLTVTDKNGNELTLKDKGDGKYTFTMPAGKVEVKATFMEDNSVLNFFYDVPNGAYFYEAVKWAVENGITTGVGNDLFAPEQSCTRAQIVTFLWRAAGSPEPKTASSFTDVSASAYYAKAVAWAVENGITNGMTETTFAPDATCTRGQSVTFLYRALKGTASGSTNFTDVKSDAFYADAISWAVANNVTNGTSNTTFSPNADCTRAEIVTFLYRAYQGK